jgi:predicted dehydrogenase
MNEPSDSTVKVALLGYGYAGKTFHAPLIESVDGMQLKLVVSSDRSKVLKDWPDQTVVAEPESAFRDQNIDVVVIATPNDRHFDLAKRALEAGKAVVVDKPFTTTVAEAHELIGLAQKQKTLLSVFHNRRWDADFITVRRLIKEGVLGEIRHFESHFDRFRPTVRQRWRERPGPGGGLWYDLGPHLVDQALQLFGPPESVYGDFAVQRHNATAVDFFHVRLRYGNMRVILHASALVAAGSARYTVHGTRGSYVKHGLDTQEDALKRGESPREGNWGNDPDDGLLTTGTDEATQSTAIRTVAGNYVAYYQAIRDAVSAGAPNPVPAEDALAVMKVLEAADSSVSSGCELEFAK